MEVKNCNDIIKDNYKEYIQYTTKNRNFPSIIDGCKPAHRRCIHQIYTECPKHFVKAATAIGAVVKAHPHPSSIFGTLVPMTQNDAPFPIFDGQGNWGSKIPESEPSAERYVEIKISDLACSIFESYSNYVDMIEGDLNNTEPQNLATFLPYCLLNGAYAIPVGLSTVDIPPLYALDLCDYAIDVLEHKDLTYKSDVFIRPNLGLVKIKSSRKEWKELISTGSGKISILPNIVKTSDRSLEIIALPETKSLEHVKDILSTEIEKDQIDVRDETTAKLSIKVEILPYKKVNIDTLMKRLISKLTVNKSYRFIYSDNDGNAVFCGVPINMQHCLTYLYNCVSKWINDMLITSKDKLRVLEVIENMKKDGTINELSKHTKQSALKLLQSQYNIDEEQSSIVLSKPMSYLTKEHLSDIKSLKSDIKNYTQISNNVFDYLKDEYITLKKMISSKFNKTATTFLNSKSHMMSFM